MPEVLIATLGTESQVVTLSLLELKRLGFDVDEVVIIHTDSPVPKIRESIERLRQALAEDERLRRYRYRFEPLQGERGTIADITTAEEAEWTFNDIFRVVRRYKLDGYRVHLNIAGGRKPMSIYGMVTAQMLFDEHDHLWHLVSNQQLVDSRRLFPEEGDKFNLVPVPVIRATDQPDLLRQAQTAQEAVREQESLRRDMRMALFLKGELTNSEREIAQLMATGMNNAEIAKRRLVRKNTVEKQINKIYGKWSTFWGLDENLQPRRQIVAELSVYLQRKGGL